ncbi:MAG TPA: site-2 protease family protein [Solirubrobacteraceae bacterium]|jgi:Zn-dependent protease
MPIRTRFQLARIFGIRVGVSGSWFVVLFLLIWLLATEYFPALLGGSPTKNYAIAVVAALGYFGSLILHELGHALMARRQGIPVAGIDLWFFGGVSHLRREPQTAGEAFKVAIAGPLVTLALFVLCVLVGTLVASTQSFAEVALPRQGFVTTPALALIGWLGFINGVLFLFNLLPAFPLDGGRIARALVWWRTGDRHRGTRLTGRAGQALAMLLGLAGMYALLRGDTLGLFTLVLGMIIYQAAGTAVVQGSFGQRIQDVKVSDIMDTEPVTVPAQTGLLDAEEQFFQRYSWPWFAVVDPARRFLGVVRAERVQAEIAAGRPALAVNEIMESDIEAQIGAEEPLESLLRSDGLRRLGAMVAVDENGVLRGVVTLAQIQRALKLAGGP